jgi:hypothetical protein
MSDPEDVEPKGRSWSRTRTLVLVVGIAAIGGVVIERARERESRQRSAANLAAEERAREQEAKRRACVLPEGGILRETISVQGACQAEVLREWKSAGTAAFPGMFDEDGALESPDGCVTTYRSWMDAPNEHGVNLRQHYICTFDPRTGRVTIALL